MLQVMAIENAAQGRIRRSLGGEGLALSSASAEGAEERWRQTGPDLVIVDLSVTPASFAWLAELRHRLGTRPVPLILLVPSEQLAGIDTASFTGDFMVVHGHELSEDELRYRVRRTIKVHLAHKASQAIQIDGLVVDPEGHEVRVDGKVVELTYQEFLLLAVLATNRGKACTRQQLLSRVWGYNDIGGTRTVDIHVRRIRAKLGPVYGSYIQTVRQVGYKFSQEISS